MTSAVSAYSMFICRVRIIETFHNWKFLLFFFLLGNGMRIGIRDAESKRNKEENEIVYFIKIANNEPLKATQLSIFRQCLDSGCIQTQKRRYTRWNTPKMWRMQKKSSIIEYAMLTAQWSNYHLTTEQRGTDKYIYVVRDDGYARTMCAKRKFPTYNIWTVIIYYYYFQILVWGIIEVKKWKGQRKQKNESKLNEGCQQDNDTFNRIELLVLPTQSRMREAISK